MKLPCRGGYISGTTSVLSVAAPVRRQGVTILGEPKLCSRGGATMKHATPSILLSVGLVTMVAVLATIGVGLWFFHSHRQSEPASTQLAESEFSQLRARFAHEQPLLDMNRRDPFAGQGMSQSAKSLRVFHTIIFDTRGGRVSFASRF